MIEIKEINLAQPIINQVELLQKEIEKYVLKEENSILQDLENLINVSKLYDN